MVDTARESGREMWKLLTVVSGRQAAVEEANRAPKPRRMAVLRGIPADDDAEEAAARGNSSQPRVVH
jgi:G:T/U-mismatch repair DNA glycosylase